MCDIVESVFISLIFRSCVRNTSVVMIAILLTVMLVRQVFDTRQNAVKYKPNQFRVPSPGAASLSLINEGIVDVVNTYTKKVLTPTKKQHIAFLKVHKAASSTIQNILYRFGYDRDLSIALPVKGHYISRSSNSYKPLLPPSDYKAGKYDIICNHVVFNYSKFQSLMYDDAFYVAIVREPLSRFISSAYYFRYVFKYPYLKKLNNKTILHDLITHPKTSEPHDLRMSRTFNNMAADFGLGLHTVAAIQHLDEEKMNEFVSSLMEIFDFVMIMEQFDDSLVMLKRYMGWSIKDILYIKNNELKSKIQIKDVVIPTVTDKEKEIFKRNNNLDYLIYQRFLKRFLNQRKKEKDLVAEVNEFKQKRKLVESFCTADNTSREAVFGDTGFGKGFRVNRHDCQLMMLDELKFLKQLKEKRQ